MPENDFAQANNDADLIALIKQYEIFLFPYEAAFTPPAGLDYELPTDSKSLGYSSDDGLTLHPEPGDDITITAHNGDEVYSEAGPGFWTTQFPGIELNKQTVVAYFDADVDPTDGSITVTKASTSKKFRLIVRALDQAGNRILGFEPKVQVSDRDDLNFVYNKQVTPNITFKTFKDTVLGYHMKWWGMAKDFVVTKP